MDTLNAIVLYSFIKHSYFLLLFCTMPNSIWQFPWYTQWYVTEFNTVKVCAYQPIWHVQSAGQKNCPLSP